MNIFLIIFFHRHIFLIASQVNTKAEKGTLKQIKFQMNTLLHIHWTVNIQISINTPDAVFFCSVIICLALSFCENKFWLDSSDFYFKCNDGGLYKQTKNQKKRFQQSIEQAETK